MIFNSKNLVMSIKDNIKSFVSGLVESGKRVPCLVTILVGDDPASKVYVANKEKACKEVGIENDTVRLPDYTSERDLLKIIDFYNKDITVDGILVQLPLPKHINEELVIKSISPEKDVDGFHPDNVANLWLGNDCIKPCTPQGIIDLIDEANINLEGKNVVVIGRSNIVGLPVAKMCLDRNATVTICHSKTKQLQEITQKADVIIVAVGRPCFLKGDMVSEGVIVIDVGINRVDGKLVGDVDFQTVVEKAHLITPVPGGVGPMTIACLLKNTLMCYNKK